MIAWILFIAVVISGICWLIDILFLRKRRGERTPNMVIEYGRSFFPVLLFVFVVRSFVVEPFRIPSGSMIPTLHIGDLIVVNKFAYGIRFPLTNATLYPVGEPQRGDVVVFHYPGNPRIDYVKRVIGLPGDTIEVQNKELYVNGKLVPVSYIGDVFSENEHLMGYQEQLGGVTHQVLFNPERLSPSLKVTVPANSYFVMGDNRDNSNDSRYWGFVPEDLLVGKAFLVLFNFSSVARAGTLIH
jgi:signal peptidase I